LNPLVKIIEIIDPLSVQNPSQSLAEFFMTKADLKLLENDQKILGLNPVEK